MQLKNSEKTQKLFHLIVYVIESCHLWQDRVGSLITFRKDLYNQVLENRKLFSFLYGSLQFLACLHSIAKKSVLLKSELEFKLDHAQFMTLLQL